MPTKYVCHSKRVLNIAKEFGWGTGARYTNLRDVREFDELGFLDINWKNYDFSRHLDAAKQTLPKVTVALDVERIIDFPKILDQAYELNEYSEKVVIVPKDLSLTDNLTTIVPDEFILGYSVPTKYGGTEIPLEAFGNRKVHLLGGRPDHQRRLAKMLNVVSIDTNRFTLDAGFGDYFDGETFRPHPLGGYENCIRDSLKNMNSLWDGYIDQRNYGGAGDV